ncbi:DUF2946 family protein [Paludisphaera mucosa]|uniref:DUF2946 family protein n=1 Tax=Paludisphaera mucosa TaxID=3030827 RepID=A0ABT6FHH3_9BACT|nr:DUF2946 family protein [Paludisphaera mucosa]MDG3007005.1 DUF2946 family protein [Paludisphaera mucosa]
MPARSRRILLNLFAVVYGFVTIAGPALHALPGLGHEAFQAIGRDGSTPDSNTSTPEGSHDCPVCNLQAQTPLHLDATDSNFVEVLAILPPDEPPLVISQAVDAPSAPRAPPLHA